MVIGSKVDHHGVGSPFAKIPHVFRNRAVWVRGVGGTNSRQRPSPHIRCKRRAAAAVCDHAEARPRIVMALSVQRVADECGPRLREAF